MRYSSMRDIFFMFSKPKLQIEARGPHKQTDLTLEFLAYKRDHQY